MGTEHNLEIAAAFGSQSAVGTVNATIKALSGSISSTDGIVLGDREAGIKNSGISLATARNARDLADVATSFTKQPSAFQREDLTTFSIQFHFKGNGAGLSATPADSEFYPHAGLQAIFKACGWTLGDWGSGNGCIMTPDEPVPLTAKVWDSGIAWVLMDVFGGLSIEHVPGNIPIAVATFEGIVESFSAAATFPTTDYTTQATQQAPVIKGVGHYWGISDTARPFTAFTLNCEQDITKYPDSNATSGERVEVEGRTITATATILGESTDKDYEHSELVAATSPTDDLQFEVGTQATGTGDIIQAYRLNLTTPEARVIGTTPVGQKKAIEVELRAVNTTANNEASLIWL